jgi:two-component system cell cycle sensor histidine kinase/response regulator CckA
MSSDGDVRRVTLERDLAVERFVLMCKAMNQCMWDWDMRTNVAWYSEAIYGVFGIDRGVTPSFERWTTYVHPDDCERVVAGFRKVVESGAAEWSDEYRFVRPDSGAILEVADRGFVMFDEGRPVRMVGVVMDVTQQRALERRLQHAQKMQAIGQLAGGVAHDFNNMLQAASLELELLRASAAAPPKVLAHATQIGLTIERAATLTRQLLMFSRLEAMQVEAIDLNVKVRELTTMLERLLGDNVRLELALSRDDLSIVADASMLDQVLVNLAVNARDAMVGAGRLAISTSRCARLEPAGHPAGPYICLEVRDSGPGIPGDVLPRIFDPFFTTKESGTGLGLATVYGIVEQHGGWIDVDTEVGQGTAFRVYVPEKVGDAAPRPRAARRANLRGTETILLVEDDDGIRQGLSTLLEHHGYRVLAAEGGGAALAAWDAAGGNVDLVITDLLMPGTNGLELAAALAARRPELAILIMSGHIRELDASLGASYQLLHKPFEGEALLATIRERLDRSRPH